MKNSKKIIGSMLVAGAMALPQIVGAAPITGGITISSLSFTPNNNDLTVATSLAITGVTKAFNGTGSFASIADGTVATFASPLAVNPVTMPSNPLWTVGDYTFNLGTEIEGPVSSISLTLSGTGTITSTNPNEDPTSGTWTATFNETGSAPNVQFSWSDVTAADAPGVPDGGMTITLLGAALTGLGLIKRKFMA